MSEKRYILPNTAQRAFLAAMPPEWFNVDPDGHIFAPAFEALARSLSENPIVPTPEQVAEIVSFRFGIPATDLNANMVVSGEYAAVEWQRRMFLAPEPEVPEPIKDLLVDPMPTASNPCAVMDAKILNERVIEAYRRGQKAGE